MAPTSRLYHPGPSFSLHLMVSNPLPSIAQLVVFFFAPASAFIPAECSMWMADPIPKVQSPLILSTCDCHLHSISAVSHVRLKLAITRDGSISRAPLSTSLVIASWLSLKASQSLFLGELAVSLTKTSVSWAPLSIPGQPTSRLSPR